MLPVFGGGCLISCVLLVVCFSCFVGFYFGFRFD